LSGKIEEKWKRNDYALRKTAIRELSTLGRQRLSYAGDLDLGIRNRVKPAAAPPEVDGVEVVLGP
jgi:hypothetical protein